MNSRSCVLQFFVCGFLLILALCMESYTDFDLLLQRHFYQAGHWLITPELHQVLKPWFYSGPKFLLGLLGGLCLLFFLLSFGKHFPRIALPPFRRACLILLLSLIFVPVLVAGSKQFTNVYCPKQLQEFGGQAVYQRALEASSPANAPLAPGKCFPGGHATGGFALMALAFCLISSRRSTFLLALLPGLTAGWIMGSYQMLRGEHFLSHTLVSMLAAYLVILTIACCVTRLQKKLGEGSASPHQHKRALTNF